VCQDPRQFKFAIICKKCDLKYATMQEARAHFQKCTSGKSVDVMCGHCEMRTSLWSAMCAQRCAPTSTSPACKNRWHAVQSIE